MSTTDRRRAPARTQPDGPTGTPREALSGFAVAATPAGHRRRLGVALLATGIVASSVMAGARYGPWSDPAADGAVAADAPTGTPPPSTAPVSVTTSTIPE